MLLYAKSSIWDFVFCVICSSALVFTLCSAFYSTQGFQGVAGTLITIAICVVLTLALFAIGFSTRSAIFGSVALALIIIAILAGAFITSNSTSSVLDDVTGNHVYYSLVALLTPVLVFVLSRRKTTIVVLAIVGILLCAVIEYLYWYGHIVAFGVFLLGVIGLFVYRVYQKSLTHSESEYFAFNSTAICGIVLALVTLLLGVGIYALIVAPLEPGNIVLKLITEHYRTDTQEVKGIATTAQTVDDQLYSNTLSDVTVKSSNKNPSEINSTSGKETSKDNTTTSTSSGSSVALGDTDDSGGGGADVRLWFMDWLPFIIAALVVVALLAAVLFKRHLRKRRYKDMIAQENGAAVSALFLFFITRFKRFKIPMPGSLTLREYASGYETTFCDFEQRSSTPAFGKLAHIYSDRTYGGCEIDDDTCSLFKDYYQAFYKNARHYVGRIKYCLLYFRI